LRVISYFDSEGRRRGRTKEGWCIVNVADHGAEGGEGGCERIFWLVRGGSCAPENLHDLWIRGSNAEFYLGLV
jgi:hypothetical protein